MSDLLKFLHHEITLPDNCVCITIDDGYKSAVVYAAPILKKYGYPWTSLSTRPSSPQPRASVP